MSSSSFLLATAAASSRSRFLAASNKAARRSTSLSTRKLSSRTSSQATKEREQPLSIPGIIFFGSLCISTFGLGIWQSKRYFEKIDLVKKREEELRAAPVRLERCTVTRPSRPGTDRDAAANVDKAGKNESSYRRLEATGQFLHSQSIYVGPRGPPPGALATSGPSSGRSSGGMASSPQGYFVITPFKCSSGDGLKEGTEGGNTILVNRGWVPMHHIKQSLPFSQPNGIVTIVGVETKTERPKFLSPEHDKRNPKTLLWMDRVAMEEGTGTKGLDPLLLTETTAMSSDGNSNSGYNDDKNGEVSFPVKPSAETVGEFKVTPFTHAGYAVTWFGLSGAGVIMTRKLITRGRG